MWSSTVGPRVVLEDVGPTGLPPAPRRRPATAASASMAADSSSSPVQVTPAPERSQCQRTTALSALASTGVPASHASMTVREKLSLRLGCT